MAEMKLEGAQELMRELAKFGPRVEQNASAKGLRKAGQYLNKEFKRAVPKRTGLLRKSLGYKYSRRSRRVYVGLRKNFYYKTLEFGREGGAPLNPFFERVYDQHKAAAAQLIVNETRKAVYYEAGRVYARSARRRR